MALTKPALTNVHPGEPVTAQGWNTLVNGLGDLYDAVLALGHGVLQVSVVSNGQTVDGARVVAEPAAGDPIPVAAVPLHGDVTNYAIVGVTEGQWHVYVSAPGFESQEQDVTVPAAAPLVFNVKPAGVAVPYLFGVATQEALTTLAGLNLEIDVMIDVLGHEVPKSSLPPQYQNQPVLAQLPVASTVVDPKTQRVRLVIATALDETPTVTMPSLVGLTYDEVASVLSGLGLKIGKTNVQS